MITTSNEVMVEANGVRICAEAFGEPTDPPILLIMGAGASMLYWDADFCRRLADGGRLVIRYDNRDTGRSTSYESGEPPYALRDLVGDAVGVLNAFGLAGAHIVGMSMGAAIGQLLALDHPDRVRSVTLVASTPGGPGHESPDLPMMSAELQAAFAAMPSSPEWSDRASVVAYHVAGERLYTGSRPFDEAAWRDLAERTFDRTTNSASSMINHFLIDAGDPWRPRLAAITAPTLVLHGTDDPFLPYGHAIALADEIPHAKLIAMDRTGHEPPPREVWDYVIPAILEHTSSD